MLLNTRIRSIHALLLAVACLAGLTLVSCKKDPPDIGKMAGNAKSVTVYDIEGRGGLKYSEEKIESAFKADFDIDLFKELAAEATHSTKWVPWKGGSLAIVEMKDGTEVRLALSYCGPCFEILGVDGAYFLEGKAAKKWDKAFMDEIVQNDFIPKRIERNEREAAAGQVDTEAADDE